jgi:hypothetical protein
MPLADLRLTAEGLCASEQVLKRLAEEAAAEASRHARSQSSAVRTTGIWRRDEVSRPWPPPADADTVRAQAWGAAFLDREISRIEGRLAELNESTRFGGEAAEGYLQGEDSEADVLANRLRIMRMQRRLSLFQLDRNQMLTMSG